MIIHSTLKSNCVLFFLGISFKATECFGKLSYEEEFVKQKIEEKLRLENHSIEQYQLYKQNIKNHLESWSLQNKVTYFIIRSIISKVVISNINVIYHINPKSLQELFELITKCPWGITKQKIITYDTKKINDNECEFVILPCELRRLNQGKTLIIGMA